METVASDITPEDVQKQQKFSVTAFSQGLAVVALLYVLIAGFLWFSGSKTLEAQQGQLASQTVLIEHPDIMTSSTIGSGIQSPVQTGETGNDGDTTPQPESHLPESFELLESGLAKAPIPGLYEENEFGRAPVRHKDGMTPFQAYRRPFNRAAVNQPIISIAIMDLGLSDAATESAIRSLPPDISFIISPYANAPDFWINESRTRGHEVWLTLPLETNEYPVVDPGPHTMLISAPERENLMKLSWLLSRASGYVGFVANRNPAFMKSTNDMRPVIGGIYNRGLGFVDTSLSPGMVPQTMALGHKAPYASVDLWIDDTPAQDAIAAALEELENKAQKQGSAVGIIHPLPVSYQEILRWASTLKDKGIRLVPLSAQTGF